MTDQTTVDPFDTAMRAAISAAQDTGQPMLVQRQLMLLLASGVPEQADAPLPPAAEAIETVTLTPAAAEPSAAEQTA